MFDRLDINVSSQAVFAEYRKLHGLAIQLHGFWEPHQNLSPGQGVYAFRQIAGKVQVDLLPWDASAVDGSSAGAVRRGLVPASAVYASLPSNFASWKKDLVRLTQPARPWVMFGISWADGGRFRLLTTKAGLDLRDRVAAEPVIVPPAHWASWLDPNSTGNLYFPSAPGSLSLVDLPG